MVTRSLLAMACCAVALTSSPQSRNAYAAVTLNPEESARGRVWWDDDGAILAVDGASIERSCPSGLQPKNWSLAATTQANGSFVLTTNAECDARVVYMGLTSLSIPIFFGPDGVVNLELTLSDDGAFWHLGRR